MGETVCKKCGRGMPGDSAFCPSCGTPIDGGMYGNKATPVADWAKVKEKDRTGPVFGGGVLVILGIALWLASSGIIDWLIWWAYFLCGLGALLSILGAAKMMSGKDAGQMVGGLVVFSIGIISIISWEYLLSQYWSLILIAIGVVIILSSVVALLIKGRTRSYPQD